MATIQSIRGMNDLLPEVMPHWHAFEQTARRLLRTYGYAEIRTPLLEKTDLFARSIGEVTDIVEKEMYTFVDRDGSSVTLRPENTASCVRAAIENGLLGQVQRLWYLGPMFRHERPQRGRYRQFFQLGAEVFGVAAPAADAELILLNRRMWDALGLKSVELELNSLGTPDSRRVHRELLIAYLTEHQNVLDEDAKRRLQSNPLRVLDSKNPNMQSMIEAAPKLAEHLDDESKAHFDALQDMLSRAGVDYVLNPRLVRGLDYYTKTVFEWTTTALGAQGTICGGGRYDGLVAQIGGRDTPGVGFSMGIERIIELMTQQGHAGLDESPHVFLTAVGEEPQRGVLALAERLRSALPEITMKVDAEDGSFRAKLRRADRSGAQIALLVGEQEFAANQAAVKYLRIDREQETVDVEALASTLSAALGE
ncbi:MAG: histidine--tRNA ligase [Pseudomonadota bacterium]